MTTFIMIMFTAFDMEWPQLEHRRIIASLLVFSLWFKMFDWMRLFDNTSFYIKLILKTVSDIVPFMAIHILFLLMFGCAMQCLSMNRGEDEEVVGSYTGWWFIDVVIDQHLITLGGFDTGNYGGK